MNKKEIKKQKRKRKREREKKEKKKIEREKEIRDNYGSKLIIADQLKLFEH